MAVAFIPPQEFPRTYLKKRPHGAGSITTINDGFAWRIMRKGVLYRGPTVAVRSEAETALEDALSALERGEMPAVAPPRGDDRPRSKTLTVHAMKRELQTTELVVYPGDVRRPQEREDCAPCPTCQDWRDNQTGDDQERLACGHTPVEAIGHSRPCLFAGCTKNLYLDENPETGAIKFNHPHIDPGDMGDSCAVDLADLGDVTLDRIGKAMNLARERIRQVEERGLAKIKAADRGQLGLPPERETYAFGKGPHSGAP